MYRRSGLTLLVIGGLVVYALVFTPFNQELRRYTRTAEGDRVLASVVCPGSWEMLFGISEVEVKYLSDAEYCVKGARLRVTAGAFIAAVTAILGIIGVSRGRRPEPIRLRPLSEIFEQLKSPGGPSGPS